MIRRSLRASYLVAVVLLLGCGEPPERWWKGNLHAHSLWSPDGDAFPETVVDYYKSRGYHFLALSDHNVLSRGDRWIGVRALRRRAGPAALHQYFRQFGRSQLERRGAGDDREFRLATFDGLRSRFDEPGAFLVIEAQEVTADFEPTTDSAARVPVHLNVTNAPDLVAPPRARSVKDLIGRLVRLVERQREGTDRPVLVSLSHPRWKWSVNAADVVEIEGLHLFEVYNPSEFLAGRQGQQISIEKFWDIVNTVRLGSLNSHPLFGLAADDAHHFNRVGNAPPGTAWIMVRAAALETRTLLTAIDRGDFYATNGVQLLDVRFDSASGELALDIDGTPGVQYMTRFLGTRRLASGDEASFDDIGAVLARVEGLVPRYRLDGDELYVRAIVTSSVTLKSEVPGYAFEQAWTQPVGWRKGLAAR